MGHVMKIEEMNSYYSNTFTIRCERMPDTILTYSLLVRDSQSGNVVETLSGISEAQLDNTFEALKSKYIFDYQAVLSANKRVLDHSNRAQNQEKKILKN